ncbi:YjcZ family sporulation protein [Bacillus sp. THAF10]|nr:YjcZ family sporulation protein [Bacillus sp. THAF10]
MHDYCYYTCGPCGYPQQVAPAYGCGNPFVLIVVLFILLIIVGACYCK